MICIQNHYLVYLVGGYSPADLKQRSEPRWLLVAGMRGKIDAKKSANLTAKPSRSRSDWAPHNAKPPFWQGCMQVAAVNLSRHNAMQDAAPPLEAMVMSALLSSLVSSWPPSLLVAAGGAMGAVGRYQLGRAVTHMAGPNAGFPWGTLSANVIGSLAMGVLVGWLARHGGAGQENLRLLLGVGLLGGFTTFSAFSLELVLLMERGSPALALTYAAVSLMAGLAALYLGLILMRGSA